VPLSSLLVDDALQLLQRNAAASATNQSGTVFYQPLTVSSSLRLAVSDSDDTLMAARATGSTPAYLTQASVNPLGATGFILLITLMSAAVVPLLVYRALPAWLTQWTDQFGSAHVADVDACHKRYPTQLGAALTWAFLCSSALVAVLLATASNVQTDTGVVPPSSVADTGSAAANFEFTLRAHSSASTAAVYCNAASNAG
jgi:hypothetical protein